MIKSVLIICIGFFYVNVVANDEMASLKEKNEIMTLKEELTIFYKKKEEEYQKNKKEIELLLKEVEDKRKETEDIYKKNEMVLEEIKGEINSKTAKIYDTMKHKTAATIFNQMMDEGKIEDVFDIIIKLKEKNVTGIMKFLDVGHASLITEKLKNSSN